MSKSDFDKISKVNLIAKDLDGNPILDEDTNKPYTNQTYFDRILEVYRAVMGYSDVRNQIIQKCLNQPIDEDKQEQLFDLGECIIQHFGILFKDYTKMSKQVFTRLLKTTLNREFNKLKRKYPSKNIIMIGSMREAPFKDGDFTHYTSIVVSHCYKKVKNNPCLKNTHCDEVFHFDSDPYYLGPNRGNWAEVSIPILREFAKKHGMNFERFNPQCQIEEHYFCQTWSMLFLEALLCGGPILDKLIGKRFSLKEARPFITKQVVRMMKRFSEDIIKDYETEKYQGKEKLPDIIKNNFNAFIDYNYKYNFKEFVRDESTLKDIVDDMIVYANEADSAKEFDILMHNYIVDDEHHHPADFMVAIKYLIDDVLVEKPYIRIAEKLIKDLENNKYGK